MQLHCELNIFLKIVEHLSQTLAHNMWVAYTEHIFTISAIWLCEKWPFHDVHTVNCRSGWNIDLFKTFSKLNYSSSEIKQWFTATYIEPVRMPN